MSRSMSLEITAMPQNGMELPVLDLNRTLLVGESSLEHSKRPLVQEDANISAPYQLFGGKCHTWH
jgi:hypothetical protein